MARLLKKDKNDTFGKTYKINALYLDPSLGGMSRMSLTRMLIRGFPDPVTEALVFWKSIHDHLPEDLKHIARSAGYPRSGKRSLKSFSKLIEDPLSLNIHHGINHMTIIKEEVRDGLHEGIRRIKNDTVIQA